MIQMDSSVPYSPLFYLPVEILNHILNYLRNDPSNLCQLARASRQLRQFVAPIIYQEISLLVSFRYLASMHGPSWQLDQILQNITTDKILGTYVRSAYIRDNRFESNSDETITTQMARLLALFPKLQTLRIKRDEHRKLSTLNMDFLEFNPMSFLRFVCIQDRTLSSTDLVRLMLLERVETVTAINFQDSNSPTLGLQWIPAKTKKLPVALHLNRSGILPVQVHGRVLRDILEWSPANLKALTCLIPRVYSGIATTQASDANMDHSILSPKLLQYALEPIQGIVERLEVSRGARGVSQSTGAYTHQRLDTDRSQVDFSCFTNLRDLNVNSTCLFDTDKQHSHHQRVFELFPWGLEKLQIIFDEDCGIFRHCSEDWDSAGKDKIWRLDPFRYRWLTEILEHKLARYPDLTRVVIMEKPMESQVPWGEKNVLSTGCRWVLPSDLQVMADKVGITVELWLENHRKVNLDALRSTGDIGSGRAAE